MTKYSDPPRVEAAIRIVREIYTAFNTGDRETILAAVNANFADDIVVHEPDSMPWGGVFRSRDVVAPMTAGLAGDDSPIDAVNIRIDSIFTESDQNQDHVVVAITFPWRGADTTITMRALEWMTVKDAQITQIQVFMWDTAAALAALNPATAASA